MKVRRKSMTSGIIREREIDVTQEQLNRWAKGEHIQDVMPDLSAGEREFIMTGLIDEEFEDWARSFEVLGTTPSSDKGEN